MTGMDDTSQAFTALEAAGWDLSNAVALFFDSQDSFGGTTAAAPELQPAPQPPPSTNTVIKTLSIDETCSLEVVEGDLTTEKVDVIVNPANKMLQHAGGLAEVIVKKGGGIIQVGSMKS
jgi:hypothetical protein